MRYVLRPLALVCLVACSTPPALRAIEHQTSSDQPIQSQPEDNSWRYAQPPPAMQGTFPRPTDQRRDRSPSWNGPDLSQLPPPERDAQPTSPPQAEAKKTEPQSAPSMRDGLGSSGGDRAHASDEAYSPPSGQAKSGHADMARPRPSMPMPPPDRPGLGTSWGESRYSQVNEVPFERAAQSPTYSASLWYNDQIGSEAMSRYASGWAAMDRATLYLARGLVVSLRDENGSALPGFRANGRIYAIGENNRRYTIVFENRTPTRFEVVASVDGLDVIDGRAGSYNKRGYIVEAYGRLEIEGFRQSSDAVAAFRFGSMRSSYAKQTTGSDRNVGVVGIALFAERQPLPYWSYREADRRYAADPFPAKWVPQPQPQPDPYYYYYER